MCILQLKTANGLRTQVQKNIKTQVASFLTARSLGKFRSERGEKKSKRIHPDDLITFFKEITNFFFFSIVILKSSKTTRNRVGGAEGDFYIFFISIKGFISRLTNK